jgi:hypothetical protein
MSDLVDKEKNEQGLTPKQVAFLDSFFGPANYDAVAARDMAGYSKTTNMKDILKPLLSHIEDALQGQIAIGAAKGVSTLIGVLNDPTKPGNKEAMAAANSLLDRFGLTKEKASQVNVKVDVAPVVYLPQKKEVELRKEDYTDVT